MGFKDADIRLVYFRRKKRLNRRLIFSQEPIASSKNLQTSPGVTSHRKKFKHKSARFF